MSEIRSIMKVEVTRKAKILLQQETDRTGMTQIALMSHLVEWYTNLPIQLRCIPLRHVQEDDAQQIAVRYIARTLKINLPDLLSLDTDTPNPPAAPPVAVMNTDGLAECPACEGKGHLEKDTIRCGYCQGKGRVPKSLLKLPVQQPDGSFKEYDPISDPAVPVRSPIPGTIFGQTRPRK